MGKRVFSCQPCKDFTGKESEIAQAEKSRSRAICCVRKMKEKLQKYQGTCSFEKDFMETDTSLKKHFGFGFEDSRISEVAENYEEIEKALKKIRLCNDTENTGNLERPKECKTNVNEKEMPSVGAYSTKHWTFDWGKWEFKTEYSGDVQLPQGFFDKPNSQAGTLIHEASHIGLDNDGVRGGEEDYEIYNKKGTPGYWDKCGEYHSMLDADRLNMMDTYANAAMENCACE